MVIYADVIFAVNFASAYAVLYILARLVYCIKPSKLRLCAASALGGVSAAVLFSADIPILASYAVRTLTVIAMVAIACYTARKQLCRQMLWFALITGIIIFSMIFATSVMSRMTEIIIKNGVIYFDLPPLTFAIAFALSYMLLLFFIKMFKNRAKKKHYIISVTYNDKTVTAAALFDSGNLLKEPVTGQCVNILEWEKAKTLFDLDIAFEDIENYIDKMRLWAVPYHSLGNNNGILFAFRADTLHIPELHKEIRETFIAIYGGKLSKNNEYHALINAELL